jgi:hypothetical protein
MLRETLYSYTHPLLLPPSEVGADLLRRIPDLDLKVAYSVLALGGHLQ